MTHAPTNAQRASRRRGCLVLLLVLALPLLWLGFKVARASVAGYSALQEMRSLQALDVAALANDLSPAQLADLRTRFARLESNLATVEAELGPFLPLTRRLGWLPGIGAEVQAAELLLALARNSATAGRAALDAALPTLEALQGSGTGSALERLTATIIATAPLWSEASAALDAAATAAGQVRPGDLDPRIGSALQQLDRYLPLLRSGVGLAQLAPTLLGADRPRTYLLLAQNSEELRPSGGFISGVGLVTVQRGRLGEIDFQDSYAIYNPAVDHPPAPYDLERTMKAEILLLRDANWSPDFPTASAVIQSLLLLDTGQQVDGIVAFDLEATRRLVSALQPLPLPGYAEPVTAANLLTALRAVWEAPPDAQGTVLDRYGSDWVLHRKDFMADLAGAARAKVERGQVNLTALLWALRSSLEERHILVALNNPQAAQALAQAGWDGALRPGDDDFLMVVDTNVGWNKVNFLVNRASAYTVAPAANGSAQAELVLTYRHDGQRWDQPCVHESRYGDTYADMIQRCYFNYLRVYAPRDAVLLSAEGFEPDTVTTFAGERGTTVMAGDLVVPPGEERTVRLRYALPPGTVDPVRYALRWQKQPGTPAWPVQVTVVGPWQPVSPVGRALSDAARWQVEMATDLQFIAVPRNAESR